MVANTVLNDTLYIFIITHNEIIMKIPNKKGNIIYEICIRNQIEI